MEITIAELQNIEMVLAPHNVSIANIILSSDAMSALGEPDMVNIALNQQSRLCTVYRADEADCAAKVIRDQGGAVKIGGRSVCYQIFKMMGWMSHIPHIIQGKCVIINDRPVLLFRLDEAIEVPYQKSKTATIHPYQWLRQNNEGYLNDHN